MDGIKNGIFLKSIDVTDNGTKKIPRYNTAVQKYRGTAHLSMYMSVGCFVP